MTEMNRQWLLARRPAGMLAEADFELSQAPRPEPAEGLTRASPVGFPALQPARTRFQPSHPPEH